MKANAASDGVVVRLALEVDDFGGTCRLKTHTAEAHTVGGKLAASLTIGDLSTPLSSATLQLLEPHGDKGDSICRETVVVRDIPAGSALETTSVSLSLAHTVPGLYSLRLVLVPADGSSSGWNSVHLRIDAEPCACCTGMNLALLALLVAALAASAMHGVLQAERSLAVRNATRAAFAQRPWLSSELPSERLDELGHARRFPSFLSDDEARHLHQLLAPRHACQHTPCAHASTPHARATKRCLYTSIHSIAMMEPTGTPSRARSHMYMIHFLPNSRAPFVAQDPQGTLREERPGV